MSKIPAATLAKYGIRAEPVAPADIDLGQAWQGGGLMLVGLLRQVPGLDLEAAEDIAKSLTKFLVRDLATAIGKAGNPTADAVFRAGYEIIDREVNGALAAIKAGDQVNELIRRSLDGATTGATSNESES